MFRVNAIRQAEQKALHGKASVFMYSFAWKVAAFDGRFKAAHAVDEPFIFGNLNKAPGFGVLSEESLALSRKIMRSWAAFAQTGNPNHNTLPIWERYVPDTRATMIFNNSCRVIKDPGQATRLARCSAVAR